MPSEGPRIITQYEKKVGQNIKNAIWSKGLTIRMFADFLTSRGAPHTFEALSRKLYRGKFSAALYALCLEILAEAPTIGARPAQRGGDDRAWNREDL